jgi:hypothetical protein
MAYTMVWGSLAIIPFLTRTFDIPLKGSRTTTNNVKKRKEHLRFVTPIDHWRASDYMSFLCIALILTPTFMLHGTGIRNISFARDRYQYLVLLTLLLAYIEILVGLPNKFSKKMLESRKS